MTHPALRTFDPLALADELLEDPSAPPPFLSDLAFRTRDLSLLSRILSHPNTPLICLVAVPAVYASSQLRAAADSTGRLDTPHGSDLRTAAHRLLYAEPLRYHDNPRLLAEDLEPLASELFGLPTPPTG